MRYFAAAIATLSVAMSIGESAARDRISLTANDIEFNVDMFEDSRIRPYRVVFEGTSHNIFDYDTSGIVEILRIGTERYRVVYTSTGDIKRVILKPSDRRELTQYEDEEDVDEQGSSESYEYYYCDDCADTWDAVCDEGVPSVCRLVGFGSPFSAEASAAIEVVCNTFGEACSGSTGNEACEGQCGGDGNYDKGVNACLDPASEQYKCAFTGLYSMRLDDCGLVDDDLPHLPACFETFGKTNLHELYFNYGISPTTNVLSTFPEDTFAGLTQLTILSMGQLGLTTLPPGIFSALFSLTNLSLLHNSLTTLPSGLCSDLVRVQYMYLYENNLVTLPDRAFEGCSSLKILNLSYNELVGFPAGAFTGMFDVSLTLCQLAGIPASLSRHLGANNLTTLPDGLFSDITRMDALTFLGNPDLQCVPSSQGAGIHFFTADEELGDILNDGMCECSPEVAVICGAGTSCKPGAKGYTCV